MTLALLAVLTSLNNINHNVTFLGRTTSNEVENDFTVCLQVCHNRLVEKNIG